MDLLHRLDDALLMDVDAFARATGWLHTPLVGYAKYGLVVFGLLLLSGVVLARTAPTRRLASAGWAGVATLVAVGVNQPIVALVSEARPYTTHPGLLVLATRSADPSFPSDHAVMAGAAAAGLLLVSRRLGLVAAGAALLMAFARVYIAAHYPWDVVAGLAVGAGVALLGWLLLRDPLTSLTGWLRRQPGMRAMFAERDARSERGFRLDLQRRG